MRVFRIVFLLALLILSVDTTMADTTIREFSGSGGRNTRPFEPQGPWEITWNAKGDIFQVYVYSASGDMIGIAANQKGPGTGASYQPTGGAYYIQTNALGAWSIQVIEVSGQPASPDDSGQVLSVSGSGGRNTRPFERQGPWEITWNAKGDIFQVYVYSASGDLVGIAAYQPRRRSLVSRDTRHPASGFDYASKALVIIHRTGSRRRMTSPASRETTGWRRRPWSR